MTTFAETFKKEIARVARKELREEITALRKIAAMQRADISALKKAVKSLQAQLRPLNKPKAAFPFVAEPARAGQPEANISLPAPKGKPGRKVTFTAERLKTQRARLGFTQQQTAQLLGVSALSIWKWETGGAAPRASRVPQILDRLAMGKRDALELIRQSGS